MMRPQHDLETTSSEVHSVERSGPIRVWLHSATACHMNYFSQKHDRVCMWRIDTSSLHDEVQPVSVHKWLPWCARVCLSRREAPAPGSFLMLSTPEQREVLSGAHGFRAHSHWSR